MLRIVSTGSAAGMSNTLVIANCSRRFVLEHLRRQALDKSVPPPLSRESGSPMHLLVGSGVHCGLAQWRLDQDVSDLSCFWYDTNIEESHPESCREIRRILQWYFRSFAKNELGRPVRVEELFEKPLTDPDFPGFTGALDLVTNVNEEDIQRIASLSYGCYLPRPGNYLVDYKTAKAADKNAQQEYELRPQFTGYQILSDLPLEGVIVERIMKTQVLKKQLYFVPPPTYEQKLMVRSLVQRRASTLQSDPYTVMPNPDACLDRFSHLCPFLGTLCNRY